MAWALGKTAVGFDISKECIYSTALGEELAAKDYKDISGSDRKYTRKGAPEIVMKKCIIEDRSQRQSVEELDEWQHKACLLYTSPTDCEATSCQPCCQNLQG